MVMPRLRALEALDRGLSRQGRRDSRGLSLINRPRRLEICGPPQRTSALAPPPPRDMLV